MKSYLMLLTLLLAFFIACNDNSTTSSDTPKADKEEKKTDEDKDEEKEEKKDKTEKVVDVGGEKKVINTDVKAMPLVSALSIASPVKSNTRNASLVITEAVKSADGFMKKVMEAYTQDVDSVEAVKIADKDENCFTFLEDPISEQGYYYYQDTLCGEYLWSFDYVSDKGEVSCFKGDLRMRIDEANYQLKKSRELLEAMKCMISKQDTNFKKAGDKIDLKGDIQAQVDEVLDEDSYSYTTMANLVKNGNDNTAGYGYHDTYEQCVYQCDTEILYEDPDLDLYTTPYERCLNICDVSYLDYGSYNGNMNSDMVYDSYWDHQDYYYSSGYDDYDDIWDIYNDPDFDYGFDWGDYTIESKVKKAYIERLPNDIFRDGDEKISTFGEKYAPKLVVSEEEKKRTVRRFKSVLEVVITYKSNGYYLEETYSLEATTGFTGFHTPDNLADDVSSGNIVLWQTFASADSSNTSMVESEYRVVKVKRDANKTHKQSKAKVETKGIDEIVMARISRIDSQDYHEENWEIDDWGNVYPVGGYTDYYQDLNDIYFVKKANGSGNINFTTNSYNQFYGEYSEYKEIRDGTWEKDGSGCMTLTIEAEDTYAEFFGDFSEEKQKECWDKDGLVTLTQQSGYLSRPTYNPYDEDIVYPEFYGEIPDEEGYYEYNGHDWADDGYWDVEMEYEWDWEYFEPDWRAPDYDSYDFWFRYCDQTPVGNVEPDPGYCHGMPGYEYLEEDYYYDVHGYVSEDDYDYYYCGEWDDECSVSEATGVKSVSHSSSSSSSDDL